MAVHVRAAFDVTDEIHPGAQDYAILDTGVLSITDKPLTDLTYAEIASYAAGQWLRVVIVSDVAPTPPR